MELLTFKQREKMTVVEVNGRGQLVRVPGVRIIPHIQTAGSLFLNLVSNKKRGEKQCYRILSTAPPLSLSSLSFSHTLISPPPTTPTLLLVGQLIRLL